MTKSLGLLEDLVGGGSPGERFAVLVVVVDEVIDLGDQILDRAKQAAANGLVDNQAAGACYLVQPRTLGWGERDVPAGSGRKPGLDLGVFVSAVIVDDQMDVQVRRDRTVDPPQKSEKFLMAVPRLALGDDGAGRDVAANSVVLPCRVG